MAEKEIDLRSRLAMAEAHLRALKDGEIDAVIGRDEVSLLRLGEMEKRLERAELRYRRLTESNIIGVIISGKDRIEEANDEFLNMLGYTLKDLIKGRINWQAITPPEYVQHGEKTLRDLSAQGFCAPSEKEYLHADGKRVPVLVGASRLAQEPLSWISFVLDLSAYKKMEKQLRSAQEELEHRVSQRTEELNLRMRQLRWLASELSLTEQRERRRLAEKLHDDLQQLLVGAKINLEILDAEAGPAQQEVVARIGKLIEDAIQTSRGLTTELSPPILRGRGLIPALKWLAQTLQETHGLEVEIQAEAPDVEFPNDLKGLVFQSARELLMNVVKHAGVNRAQLILAGDRAGYLRISIRDEGRGCDPRSVQPKEMNGGFGLFSIRERLVVLGGEFEAECAPGRGSLFTLLIPLPANGPAEKELQSGDAAFPDSAGTSNDAARMIRVLLVDDHIVVREGLSILLKSCADIDVVGEASDGKEAVQLARRFRPDLILMDSSMPQMDGVEATRLIHTEFPDIRIIGLSMFTAAEQAAAMLTAGATVYLSKGGSSRELLAAIRREAARNFSQ